MDIQKKNKYILLNPRLALTGNITNWHGMCTAQDSKTQQQVIKTAKNIIPTHQPSISDIGEVRCLRRAKRILKDNSHPSTACSLRSSDKRYRSIQCCTTRLQSNFFPQAVRFLMICVGSCSPWGLRGPASGLRTGLQKNGS